MNIHIEKIVRHWGFGNAPNGYVPRKLDDIINALIEARLEIPQEYWGEAYVECEPDCEHGEYYPRLIVAYSRPETPEEAAERKACERNHWQAQLREAQQRVAYCEEMLSEKDMQSSEVPIAVVQQGGVERIATHYPA